MHLNFCGPTYYFLNKKNISYIHVIEVRAGKQTEDNKMTKHEIVNMIEDNVLFYTNYTIKVNIYMYKCCIFYLYINFYFLYFPLRQEKQFKIRIWLP